MSEQFTTLLFMKTKCDCGNTCVVIDNSFRVGSIRHALL